MKKSRIDALSVVGPAIVAIAVSVVVLGPSSAEAIPAFARKYQTSCQTCHIAFPKLNPFGEAFRLRGYRMPAETEDMIKEKPIPLGAPAYKRLWPDAVWPSDMPGTVPLSLNTVFADRTQRTEAEDAIVKTKNDFNFPAEVSLLTGGTLGETLSFFGEVVFEPTVEEGHSAVDVSLEHSQLNFNGPFGSGPAFNLKVGRFIPETAYPFSTRSVLTTEGPANVFTFNPIGPGGGAEVGGEGAGIAVPESVDGLEAYGILRHRFLYSGGLANGIGPGATSMDGNNRKDYFGRVAYKIGGLALDGDGYAPSEKNWQERSLRLGLFAYRGDGTGIFVPVAEGDRVLEDRTFVRSGFDANLFFQDLNVIGGFVRGRDTLAEYLQRGDVRSPRGQGDFTYHTWFAEGDYVVMPWLHGATRYEWLRPAREGEPDFKRIIPNLTALIRANVKAYLEYQRDLGASDNYLLEAALRFAF
jgi:hypothetical protein